MREYALSSKDLIIKRQELENKYSRPLKDVFDAINYSLDRDKLEID